MAVVRRVRRELRVNRNHVGDHHSVMDQVHRTDRGFHLLTVLFLMLVAFIPFPTAVFAAYLDSPHVRDATTAALFFGAAYVALSIAFNLLWRYAVRNDLLRDAADPGVHAISSKFRSGPLPYLAVTLLALVSVQASVLGFVLLAFYWALAHRISRPTPGRSPEDS